jgi:YD repeat-containing protein
MKHAFLKTWMLFLILASSLVGLGQATPPKVIPPSPNAAAFAKYGNIPVSPYTGIPSISIPIYEIKVRDISVPISLSYHASGIKVGDEASPVGLGWVLNAGGLISRNIINRDDLQQLPDAFLSSNNIAPAIPQGPFSPPVSLVQAPSLLKSSAHVDRGPILYKYYNSAQSGTPVEIDLTSYLQMTGNDPLFRPNDFEPDQFTYNFLGYSGKFVLNKAREVILEKQEKIRIRVLGLNEGNPVWEITTPDGFIYKFLDFEYIIDNNTPGYQQRTAWYLTEIISPQNERVTFYYATQGQQYTIPVGSFYERWSPIVVSCGGFPCPSIPNYRMPIVGKNYLNIWLDRIEWSTGKIKFNVAVDRLDIEGDRRITSVQIFKKNSELPYEEVVLDHSYFTSSSAGAVSENEFPTNNPDKALKRLKLNGVTRRTLPLSSNQAQQHFFTYYDDQSFPPKNSFARDHWGYYNGRHVNKSLVPSHINVVTSNTSMTDLLGVMGPERNASTSFYQERLSLKSITYPTKGVSTFYYSSNEYEALPTLGSPPETYTETEPFIYNTNNKGVVQSTLFDLRDEYVNPDGDVIPVVLNGAFRTNIPTSCNLVTGAPNVFFELVNEAGLTFGRVTPNGDRCPAPDDPNCAQNQNLDCVSCCTGSMVFVVKKNIVLPPGKYFWKAFMESTEVQIVDISAQYTWVVDATKRTGREADGSLKKYLLGGGLRISKIVDYDPASNKNVNVRRYIYNHKTDIDNDGVMESHSYGKIMAKPRYSYYHVSMKGHSDIRLGTIIDCLNCFNIVRDSGHPLANYSGNHIGYDKVIEYYGENGENGYTEYEYENIEDVVKEYEHPYPVENIPFITIDKVPIQPPFSASVKNPGNGNLKKQTVFSSAGTKLMSTENTYQSKYNNVMYGMSTWELVVDPAINLFAKSFVIMSLYEAMNSKFPFLSESTTTNYLPSGLEASKVTTQYFYDSPSHLQVTKRVRDESNLHKTVTNIKYPADYSDAESNAAIVNMKGEKFMHALPVETTVLDQDPNGLQKITQREFTVYDNFGTLTLPKAKVRLKNTTPLSPASVASYVPANPYDQSVYGEVFSLEYNGVGNIKRIQKTSDIPMSYLWGYSETLPIAEIANGQAAESFFTSFEEDGTPFTNASGNLARTGTKVGEFATFTFPTSYAPVESNTLMSYWYWQTDKWSFSGIVPFQRTVSTSGTKIDEVRAFPKNSTMTTYTYEPTVGMTSVTDPNNITTYYEYDEFGRLLFIRDNKGSIVKNYKYHFKD